MGNLRIISGIVKGYHLHSVPGDVTRPITDRVKGALFNILGPDIIGSIFLDLFAGTGSVGIEALSRGADYVCFIDNNRKAYETIKKNLEHTSFNSNVDIQLIDAFSYLKQSLTRKFDYIYIAPPQYKKLWTRALQGIDLNPLLVSPDAWIIVQIDPLEYIQIELKNFTEFDQRKYGDTLLVFYR
jgi:16S rRNA (guanine966-N2)-methyltransferase